jgi:predicted nucleotidyltransferase
MIKLEAVPADILSRIPEVQQLLERERRVIFAYLFGGMASGRVTPLSDVDIAVYVSNDSDLSAYKLELFDKLTGVLGTAELDLIILNSAPLSLSGRIVRNRKVLVDKDHHRRYEYESIILRKFFDFRIKEADYFRWRYGRG